jgi:hypothetical protein
MKGLLAIALAVLLSGCLVEEDPQDDDAGDTGGPGPDFAPQQGTAHGSNAGIDVDVVWRACDAGFCANATATNQGTRTVKVSNICVPPWTERMTKDGEEVQHQEGRAYCAAYGVRDFAPGDVAFANFTWDQRVWDDEAASDAPEGSYTWAIAFWWEDPQSGTRPEAVASIQLVVGET